MITSETINVAEAVTDESLAYTIVAGPTPAHRVVRVPRPRVTLAQRLRLSSPGFDEVVEDRYYWSCSAGTRSETCARWTGYADSHDAAWDEAGECLHAWAAKYDQRAWVLAQ